MIEPSAADLLLSPDLVAVRTKTLYLYGVQTREQGHKYLISLVLSLLSLRLYHVHYVGDKRGLRFVGGRLCLYVMLSAHV